MFESLIGAAFRSVAAAFPSADFVRQDLAVGDGLAQRVARCVRGLCAQQKTFEIGDGDMHPRQPLAGLFPRGDLRTMKLPRGQCICVIYVRTLFTQQGVAGSFISLLNILNILNIWSELPEFLFASLGQTASQILLQRLRYRFVALLIVK